jgi:putative nucleotidyltransferase with HDIG domain
VTTISHLARRFVGSLSRRPPDASDLDWVRSWLNDPEFTLWRTLAPADQRHAIVVARRFADLAPQASPPEMAAALLHDIGKLESGLGTAARVMATLVGPRTDRFRLYHEHEQLGAEMLRALGSDPVTVSLVASAPDAPRDALIALRAADQI